MSAMLRPGDPVIFSVSKISTDPGPRAFDVHPAAHGETYSYCVAKFWRVASIDPSGRLLLVTRRGKQHEVAPNDPRLRIPVWWERWLYNGRFPSQEQVQEFRQTGHIREKQRA